MAIVLEQLIRNLADSGLLPADEVISFQEDLSSRVQPVDPDTAIKELITAGKLTPYQAECLCRGETNGLAFDEYVILDRIGQGGMGVVLRARHRRMDRVVAVKRLPANAIASEDAVQRFHREVKAAARLSHPNIVTAYDAREHDGNHFLVMEYVDGQDLAGVLQQQGPLPVALVIDFVIQAGHGLAYAHSQGIVHRDIKPGNLLLDRRGVVKILDMGLALVQRTVGLRDATPAEQLTASGQLMGTCDYMAPEQAENTHAADHRADIYSLGCTLYCLLSGKSPFAGNTPMQVLLAHREEEVPSLCVDRSDVPRELDAICRRMLAKRPADRYQSLEEVIAALAALRSSDTSLRLSSHPFEAGCHVTKALDQFCDEAGSTTDVGHIRQTSALDETIVSGTDQRPSGGARHRWPVWLIAGGLLAAFLLLIVGSRLFGPANRAPEDVKAAMTNGSKPQEPAPPIDERLDGTVDVLVWNPQDDSRRRLALGDPGALPLRAGDQIRVTAELNRAAHVYIVWIDTEGAAWPVYPWNPGQWIDRPVDDVARKALALPEKSDEGWPMQEGPGGMETLVLLARDTPLPENVDLAAVFSGLPAQPVHDPRTVVWFEQGEVVTKEQDRLRAPNFFNTERIDDPVLQTQRMIAEKLGPHFTLIRAVSFSNRGK